MIEKFGKSRKGYHDLNSVFYDQLENEKFLKNLRSCLRIYKKQPKRKNCKLCNQKLNLKEVAFKKNGIKWFVCKNCGQLNAEFQDTNKYNKLIYEKDYGISSDVYSKFSIEDYDRKVNNVYLPKVDFLLKVLKKEKVSLKNIKCCDFGTGSGFLLKAFLKRGVDKVIGYEVNNEQVKYGNKMLGRELIIQKKITEVESLVEETDAQIITSIFHLEHIANPLSFLNKVKKNKNIKFLYAAVPLYSFGAIFEILFENLTPRVLGESHTHLYTNESIEWIEKKLNIKLVGAWWFGGDIFDLHKSIFMSLSKKVQGDSVLNKFNENFQIIWDSFQKTVDKKKLCSEVHLVYKVNND